MCRSMKCRHFEILRLPLAAARGKWCRMWQRTSWLCARSEQLLHGLGLSVDGNDKLPSFTSLRCASNDRLFAWASTGVRLIYPLAMSNSRSERDRVAAAKLYKMKLKKFFLVFFCFFFLCFSRRPQTEWRTSWMNVMETCAKIKATWMTCFRPFLCRPGLDLKIN